MMQIVAHIAAHLHVQWDARSVWARGCANYGQVREHQPVVREPHLALDLPVTHDRRGHSVLDGNYLAHLAMKDLIAPFPKEWERQGEHFFGRTAVQGN